MSKKRMIIVTSVILSIVVISLGIVKLYQTYAIGNYFDTESSATFGVNITENTSVRIPANGYSNVFYMVTNTSPGTVRYGVAYTTDSNVTVKTFSTSKDPASGVIEENEKKYVKLRLENSSSTAKDIAISTVLGYSGDSTLLPPSGVTLVTEIYNPTPLAKYITGLYTSGTKTAVTNNSITYNTVTAQSLINDRLGGTTSDYNGGNIRYYGASPNNYIYFNCSDYRRQTSDTCEVWRIIGVFDGKTKIIRNTSLGALAWDQDKNNSSSSTTYDNNWSTSTLQKLLNGNYYNGTSTVTYYSGESGGTTSSLNMTSIGLKNNSTRNMIANTKWSLGAVANGEYDYANQVYASEVSTNVYSNNPTSWTGKIGLPLESDYAYAMDLKNCTVPPIGYSHYTACSNNWIRAITTSMDWLLSSSASSGSDVCFESPGYAVCSGASNESYYAKFVLPVLYLDSGVLLETGAGTSSNPYKISGGSSSNLEEPIPTYTVSYNANNGTGAPSSQTKTQNVNLTLSNTAPTRSGYQFVGWNTSSNGTGTSYASGAIYSGNSNLTLYAQWKQIFTISYSASGATGTPSSQTKLQGNAVTLSSTVPTKSGYTFNNWNTSSDGTGTSYAPGATYSADANATLYAQWKQVYTITYNANGGSGVPSNQTKTQGNSVTLSSTKPTRSGYKFVNWNTASNGTGTVYNSGATYSANANVTLYAQWTPNTVLIKLSVNGGVLSSKSSFFESGGIIYLNGNNIISSINYGETLSSDGLPDWNNTNYINVTKAASKASSGAEWKCLNGNCSKSTYNQTTAYSASDFCNLSSGDCTVTLGVNWTSSTTATFFPNGGKFSTGAASYTMQATVGTKYQFSELPIPSISKSNCTLDGWYEGSTSGSIYRQYFYLESGDTNLNYYAHWSCGSSGSSSTYTATFYPNGGSFSTGVASWSKAVIGGNQYYFSNLGIPSVSRSNCSQDGWHFNSPTGTVYRQWFSLDSSAPFYANWSCSCSCQYVTKTYKYVSGSSTNNICTSTEKVCNGTQLKYTGCSINNDTISYRQWYYVC